MKKEHRKQKRNFSWNIIWFNLPLSSNGTTSVTKLFLNFLDVHFPKSNQFHKIFNRGTVKVSYRCTENLSSIIKTPNKKVIYEKITPKDPSNCRNRNDCPLDSKCIYKCTASTTINLDKVYLGIAEGNLKKAILQSQDIIKKRKNGDWRHPLKICMESKGQKQKNIVLKVVSRRVCPRKFKYCQEVLATSSRKSWNHQLP